MTRRPLLPVLVLSTVVLLSATAMADKAAIFDMTDWETGNLNYAPWVLDRCIAAKDTWDIFNGSIHWRRESDLADNDPAANLQTWCYLIDGSRAVDITSHGGSGGSISAEFYDSWLIRDSRFGDYIAGQYDNLQIKPGWITDETSQSPDTLAYTISWTPVGIRDYLSSSAFGISAQAIVYADYCMSYESALDWGLDLTGSAPGFGGAIFCYTSSQPPQPTWPTAYEENIFGAMSSLGCFVLGRNSTVGDAEMEITNNGLDPDITVLGDLDTSYNENCDCNNPAAVFDGTFAFDGNVVFRTIREKGSVCFFVMGVDTWRDANTKVWKDWDVLARVRPEGGEGVAQLYEVVGVPDKAVYRVVEVDRYGRPTFSPVFVQTARPADYDEWLARGRGLESGGTVWDASATFSAWIPLEIDPKEPSARHGATEAAKHAGQLVGGRADSTGCADIVVYTNVAYDSLLVPVVSHLSNHATKKVLYYTGNSSLASAQACYGTVCTANSSFNQSSGTDRFPVDDPGPLLLLVGDSGAAVSRTIVQHLSFPDTYDRCFEGTCRSERDATDSSGSGWVGLVHRIPGATVAEVAAACDGADDWNNGQLVDPSRHVILLVGAELGGVCTDWWGDITDRAASGFLNEGFLAYPVLVDTAYETSAERVAAFDSRLDEGAAVVWGLDRTGSITGSWPGEFVAAPESSAVSLHQRFVALLPHCSTAKVEYGMSSASAPPVERWMFLEPDQGQLVGIVGHLCGAWEHQHRKAEELYMAAWAEAPHDVPLDWVVWRAAQMAGEQGLDWMEDYFRSAATMGALVFVRPGGGWTVSMSLSEDESLLFCPADCGGSHADSMTATITVRDGIGDPLPGVPPADISVYAEHSTGHTFAFACEDTCEDGQCLHPLAATDNNGQAFVPVDRAGGHDEWGQLRAVVDHGAAHAQVEVSASLEVKSPDINGDGDVNPVDFTHFTADMGDSLGWIRSDFNYDGVVDVMDFVIFSGHYGHSCASARALEIPAELLAQLGLSDDEKKPLDLPMSYELLENVPNPFNPVTTVGFAVAPPGGRVRVAVYDVAGREVAVLVDGEYSPGWYGAVWDGCGSAGIRVASGVYFTRMDAPGYVGHGKMVLVE